MSNNIDERKEVYFFLVDGRRDFLENSYAVAFQIGDGIELKTEADQVRKTT